MINRMHGDHPQPTDRRQEIAASRRPGPTDECPDGTARHVSRVAARSRLEDELRSIAIDLLGPNGLDELSPACANWVATTTETAITAASAAALDALVKALDSLLLDVPPDVARRLDEARIRHDAGYA